MNRVEPAAAAQTDVFVEPTSVTVHASGAASSAAATCGCELCHRGRDDGEVGAVERRFRGREPASSTAPRSAAIASIAGSVS